MKSVDLSGRRVLGAPEFSGQIGINYEHPVDLPFGYRGVGFFWLSQTYRSGVALVNPLSSYGWQSAYGLTNLGVGVRSEDDRYSFQIWAKNVGDRRYFVGAGAATAARYGGRSHRTGRLQSVGSPRIAPRFPHLRLSDPPPAIHDDTA